jgi:FkbM family methyltransferase
MNKFLEKYSRKIFSSLDNDFEDNWDEFRFGRPDPVITQRGKGKPFPHGLLNAVALTTGGLAKQKLGTCKEEIAKAIDLVAPHIAKLEWLYAHLADEESKLTLVDVFAYRALGHRKIKLAVNCPKHWDNLRLAETLVVGDEEISAGCRHFKLVKMDLSKIGYPIQFYYAPVWIVIDFIEQQYRCETANGSIECKIGDHVIDAGGCWGDTALYFAHNSGPNGKVYSFEFLPENLKIYNQNLDMNPDLKKRVDLIPHPVWSKAGEEVEIRANGPGTRIEDGQGDKKSSDYIFKTESIDHLLESGRIEKLDFIKMDIEGAELPALRGAEKSIRRFKPDMAITVYHSLEDFWQIPQYLESLNLGYMFYLRHFTIHAEETVLFAKCFENNCLHRFRK